MLACMSQQTTPDIADRFDRHWRLVDDIIWGGRKGLGPTGKYAGKLHPSPWRIIHRELVLAESLLRRLLVLLALSMTTPILKARQASIHTGPQAPVKHPNRAASKRTSLFHLTEPDDTAPYLSQRRASAPSTPPPRFWTPGMDAMYPPLPPLKLQPTAPRETDTLVRRLGALQDVLAHPGKHTARMARWIAARRAIANDDPYYDGRTIPIRHGHPPGVTQKRLRSDYLNVRRFGQHALAALLKPPHTG